jgi:WD40 repeat protein
MYIKLFLKELRERASLVVFPFLIMLIFVLIILTHPGQRKEVVEYLYGMMFLIFLPLTSLLLGASAFQPEFKDDAWAYLFSRPVARWKIWAVKFFSLSAIQFAILAFFFLVDSVLLKRIEISLSTYNLSRLETLESDSVFLFTLVVCISAFGLSFCLSFLHEKQYVVLIASILTGVLVFWGLSVYFTFIFGEFYLWVWDYDYKPMLFYLLAPVSLMLASILTFMKSDFSQAKKRIWSFSKFALLFLVISLGLETARFFTYSYESITFLGAHKGDAYFATDRGIFRYFLNRDKLERIEKLKVGFHSWNSLTFISIGDEKLYYYKYFARITELWALNTDGSQEKVLLERSNTKESPLYNLRPHAFVISQDGKRIAFAAEDLGERSPKRKTNISFMNLDGTGLIKKPFDIPSGFYVENLLWQEDKNSMILVVSNFAKAWIAKFDIEKGDVQGLTDSLRIGYFRNEIRISPHQDRIAFCSQRETGGLKNLTILDVRTLEKKEIYAADSIEEFKWSSDGDKIAFLVRGSELWVHSLGENKSKKIKVFEHAESHSVSPDFDFIFDGQKLAVVDKIGRKHYLKILTADGRDEAVMKIPFRIKYGVNSPDIYGLGNIVLVRNIEKEDLWRANLDTMNWRRIYR